MSARSEILVVDDEPIYRSIISKGLRSAGYHTLLAKDGQEALVVLWEKPFISLVVLDVHLPVINGLNIFDIIRKYFKDKKIIVTSAIQKEGQKFLIYDADDYYDKSQQISNLIAKVKNVLKNDIKWKIKENDYRNNKRRPVIILANCENINDGTPPVLSRFISYTKDLSPTGGRFIVGEDIKVGQFFTMALELPGDPLPLMIDCEAVWVKKLDGYDPNVKAVVEAGVRFVKVDAPHDEEKLKKYLKYD